MHSDLRHYQKVLLQQLAHRQKANTRYSLRAYAKLLGLQPPTLSAILKGKRGLPVKYGEPVATKLGLPPLARQRFLKSLLRKNNSPESTHDAFLLQNNLHHQIIAEWEHYAILSLTECREFVSSSSFVARRLGIPETRARHCLQNLFSANLLKIEKDGTYVRNHADVKTTEDVPSLALQESHRESLRVAMEKLALGIDQRDFSSGVIVMPKNKMPAAKKLIRKFRQSFYELMEDNEGQDVFHLCVQFFPLTQQENPK